jgi:hypothetical protein
MRHGEISNFFYRFRFLLLILYFLILTCVFTRPVWTRIGSYTAGGYGDNLYFIWLIGWVKQAIFELGHLPYKSHLLNFPYGYNLATTEIAPLQLLIALPFAVLFNPVFGYNISMMATFLISGLTMFYWVYSMTKSWGAGLISSTAFAFLPYHCAQFLIGHLNIAAIQWFPLYFMGFISVLQNDNFSWKNTLILSAGIAGIALTSQYYLYMTFIVSLIIAIIFLLFIRKDQARNGQMWKQFLVTAAINLPVLAVGVVPYFLLHRGENSVRQLQDVMGFSASLTDFFLPFTKSLLAGRWVSEHFPRDLWNEGTLYLGIPVLFLAFYEFIKNKSVEIRPIKQLLGIGIVAAAILAMGTNLTWMEQPVVFQTPDFLKSIIHQDTFLILLPGYLLFRYLPFYNVMRVWMRFGIITLTLVCAAAGLGAGQLLKTLKNPARIAATVGLIGLILLDFMNTPFGIVKIQPRKVDLWLADQAEGGQVQLPLKQSFQESAIFYTLTNQKPLLGEIRTFPSYRYFKLEPILRNFPDEESVEALKKEQITYIVLDEAYYTVNEAFISAGEKAGLYFAVSINGQSVFIIRR